MTDRTKPGYDVYLSSNGEVTLPDLEQILHSLVTYGDRIWLPSNYSIAPFVPAEKKHLLDHTLSELREAKLVQLWSLEGTGKTDATDLVIPIENQRTLTGEIDESVGYEDNQAEAAPKTSTIDTASRFIEHRNELWKLGIATECGASGIVYRSGPERTAGDRFEQISTSFSHQLFSEFQIDSLIGLSARDVLDARSRLADFRARVDLTLLQAADSAEQEAAVLDQSRTLYRDYLRLVDEQLRDRSRMVNLDFALNVVGLVLPVAGIVPLAQRFFMWLKDRQKYRFALYMHTLKRQLAKDVK